MESICPQMQMFITSMLNLLLEPKRLPIHDPTFPLYCKLSKIVGNYNLLTRSAQNYACHSLEPVSFTTKLMWAVGVAE
eukprot:1147473-Pelagomonas_calceolata.AAC.6